MGSIVTNGLNASLIHKRPQDGNSGRVLLQNVLLFYFNRQQIIYRRAIVHKQASYKFQLSADTKLKKEKEKKHIIHYLHVPLFVQRRLRRIVRNPFCVGEGVEFCMQSLSFMDMFDNTCLKSVSEWVVHVTYACRSEWLQQLAACSPRKERTGGL